MPTSWYPDIELWFKKYNFDEEVMIALFGYCFDKSALHRNYIQTVAEAWAKNNIRTFTDLDMYYEKQEKLNLIANTISKKLSLKRNLSQYEYAYVEKWVIDFKYNLDIIEIALKRTTSKANPSFDYLDKLLSDWHDRGFTTTEEIQKFLLEMKEKYGDKRRTEIIQGTFDIEDEDLIPVEDVIISLTNNGYVKRMPVDTYKSQNRGGRGVKGMATTQDDVISSLIHMSTHDDLLIFTNKGKVYRLKGYNIPEFGRTAKGLPLSLIHI